MASFGHVLVGLALSRAHQRAPSTATPSTSSRVSWLAFPALALLPDLDYVALRSGLPRALFEHRGPSHALLTGLVIGALAGALLARFTRKPLVTSALLGALAMLSHGLLDTLTTGTQGVALLWPFSDARFSAPWRPLPGAPLGLAFISLRGLYCVVVELVVFSPCLAYALWRRRPVRVQSGA